MEWFLLMSLFILFRSVDNHDFVCLLVWTFKDLLESLLCCGSLHDRIGYDTGPVAQKQ